MQIRYTLLLALQAYQVMQATASPVSGNALSVTERDTPISILDEVSSEKSGLSTLTLSPVSKRSIDDTVIELDTRDVSEASATHDSALSTLDKRRTNIGHFEVMADTWTRYPVTLNGRKLLIHAFVDLAINAFKFYWTLDGDDTGTVPAAVWFCFDDHSIGRFVAAQWWERGKAWRWDSSKMGNIVEIFQ